MSVAERWAEALSLHPDYSVTYKLQVYFSRSSEQVNHIIYENEPEICYCVYPDPE